MNKIHHEKKNNRNKRPIMFILAATLVLATSITALAVVHSFHDAARLHMGISKVAPITEWTEYSQTSQKNRDAAPDKANEDAAGHVDLIATMCSGDVLEAYLGVSPVDQEISAALMNHEPQYEWFTFSVSQTDTFSGYTEQVDYDTDTQTALVRVSLHGDTLRQAEQVSLQLELRYQMELHTSFEVITIPITRSESLSCSTNVIVENTQENSDFISRKLLGDALDYRMIGNVKNITVYAAYIDLKLEAPTLSEWSEAAGLNLDDLMTDVAYRRSGLAYMKSWIYSLNRAFDDVWIYYKDGSSHKISLDDSKYGGGLIWDFPSGSIDDSVFDGHMQIRFTPQKPFDLNAIQSIVVDHTVYSFCGN